MRSILLALLPLLVISCTKVDRNDWEQFNLYGKVKSIKEYEAQLRFGEIVNEVVAYEFIQFDRTGNLIEFANHNLDGELETKGTFIYDRKGNKTAVIHYDPLGDIKAEYKWEYDSKGNQLSETLFDSYGAIEHKREFQYDSNGNLVVRNYYDSNGELYGPIRYKYDDDGNILEVYYPDVSKTKPQTKYQYDSEGNAIQIASYFSLCDCYDKSKYRYDLKGNEIESASFDRNDDLEFRWLTNYKFDEAGNWTERSEVRHDMDGQPEKTIVTIREIEYY